MEDGVDALAGAQHPVTVAHVTDQEADIRARDAMALIELLGLIAAEDAHDIGAAGEEMVDQARADGPRTARDEDATAADV